MPLYKTVCSDPKCGDVQEEFRQVSQGARKQCPKCRSKVYQEYGLSQVKLGGYSPMHPRAQRGKGNKNKYAV